MDLLNQIWVLLICIFKSQQVVSQLELCLFNQQYSDLWFGHQCYILVIADDP